MAGPQVSPPLAGAHRTSTRAPPKVSKYLDLDEMWTPRQRHTLRALPVRVIAPVVDLGDAVDLEADPIIGPHREEVGPRREGEGPLPADEKVSGAPARPPPPQSKASAVVEEGTGLVSVGPAGAVVCGAPAMAVLSYTHPTS